MDHLRSVEKVLELEAVGSSIGGVPSSFSELVAPVEDGTPEKRETCAYGTCDGKLRSWWAPDYCGSSLASFRRPMKGDIGICLRPLG